MCYIICMTSSSECYVASGAKGGFGAVPSRKKKFLMKRVTFLPRFPCPLLGGLTAHGFCRWYSIFR
jgi:hypothetical protein